MIRKFVDLEAAADFLPDPNTDTAGVTGRH